MRKIILSAIMLLTLSLLNNSMAQDYKFHRVYFYNFTKYIQWPENFNENEVFIIAVAGDNGLKTSLEEMAENKTAGNMKFSIISVSLDQARLPKMNMLYIPPTANSDLVKWKSKLKNEPTLIITESEGMGQKGSMINFIDDKGRLKFEINRKEIESAGLKVATELIRFGIEI